MLSKDSPSPFYCTHRRKDGALLHSSLGICFSPGVLREQTYCHTAEWDGPGWKEAMSALNKWAKGDWWDRFDGVLFGLALSMAHWEVSSFGSTCTLIRFQGDDTAGTEKPLCTAAVGQSQLRQTWGWSAASPTAWRRKTSKVKGGLFFSTLWDSDWWKLRD